MLGIPAELFVWVGVALFMTVLLTLTTFGRRVYAVGVNSARPPSCPASACAG